MNQFKVADYTNHVEHLRTIQFTLLVVCVVVIALSYLDRGADVKKAYSNIKDIKSFVFGNFVNPNWLQDYKKDVEDNQGVKPINPTLILLEEQKKLFKVKGYEGLNQVLDIDLDREKAHHLFTLENFKKQWNMLYNLRGQIYISYLKEDIAVFDKVLNHYKLISWTAATDQNKKLPRSKKYRPLYPMNVVDSESKNWLKKCQMEVDWNSKSWFDGLEVLRGVGNKVLCMTYPYGNYENNGLTNTTEKQKIFLEKHLLILPVDVETIPYSPLNHFISKSGFNWPNRSFEMAFKELESVTKMYQDIQIDKIETILTGEYARAGGKIQVFGADLPAATAREWGGLIIAIIQLYFFLHFRVLFYLLKDNLSRLNSIPTAWIGLYSDKIAHYVFLFVSSVLPALSILLLLLKTIYLNNYNIFILGLSLIPLIISIIISYFTWIHICSFYRFQTAENKTPQGKPFS